MSPKRCFLSSRTLIQPRQPMKYIGNWHDEQLGALQFPVGFFRLLEGILLHEIDRLLVGHFPGLQADVELRERLVETVRELARSGPGSTLTRIHGDLHLGQVLVANGNVYIIDFEGEPTKPMALRRVKNHRLRDVAGMLRSFDYAAAVVKRKSLASHAHVADPSRDAFLRTFVERGTQCFLNGYAEAFPAEDVTMEQNLLQLFLLEKAGYEIAYEAANRPAWIEVPLHSLAQLLTDVSA